MRSAREPTSGSPRDGTGVVGHVYEFKGLVPETIDLGAENYAVPARWTDLTVQPAIADYYPNLGNLTKSDARAIGLLVVLNDLRAASEAYIDNAIVDAGGSVTVNAEEFAQLLSEALSTVTASGGSFYGTGSVQAINGQVVTNVVLSSATAAISDSDVTAGGDVDVTAANHAGIDATLLAATNSGDLAFAISLAFNSLGWHSQNILFNLVDTILGDPLIAAALNGEDPSLVSATITNSTIDADGDVNVIAIGATLLNATVSNAADSTASALFNATGKAIGLTVAQNKVSSQAYAAIEDSDVTADGDLTVRAVRRGRHLVEHQDRLLVADDERRRRRRPAGRDQQLHRRRQVPLQRRAPGRSCSATLSASTPTRRRPASRRARSTSGWARTVRST